ncbi:MAG: phage tail protein, partial [Clostridia bacterium]|nr:phage tail protein [Clostridia bacterium]
MIFLYERNEQQFAHNGIGAVSDALSALVTEERNGSFEMEMVYPMKGIHFAELQTRRILFSKASPGGKHQPFRIYAISKPMNGRVTVKARHISYDLSGSCVQPFEAADIGAAMQGLTDNAVTACPFTFTTDKSTAAAFSVKYPSTIRSLLGGKSGSLLDVYGGEYTFDRYNVHLAAQRGANNGVAIRYGKNLTDLKQEENISAVATGVYPYWMPLAPEYGNLVTLPEKIVPAPGTYDFTHVAPLDLSAEWPEAPTEEMLRARAERYVKDNAIGIPKVSLSVSFQALANTEEYKHIVALETVHLCDTVAVYYPELGVQAEAKCIKTVYDALHDKYLSVSLGDAKTTLADTIAGQQQQIEGGLTGAAQQAAATSGSLTAQLNNLMANALGFYASSEVDAVGRRVDYYHDQPTRAGSTVIYKIAASGFAVSADGGQTWNAGVTPSGNIVAKILEAHKIQSPTDPSVYIDLLNGIIAAKYLMDSTTSSKVQLGSDGTTSEGMFLIRDGIMRMMLSSQPYDGVLSGWRSWLLTRNDLHIQGADNADGIPLRII